MRFRSPFDDVQRAEAKRAYRQFRANLRTIREKFPPETPDETARFLAYHDLAQEFARELRVPNDIVRVARLNELQSAALRAAMQYNIQRGLRGLYGPD